MQIEIAIRYHCTPNWMAKSKPLIKPSACEDVEQHSFLLEMQNGAATLEDSLATSYNTTHILL